MYAIWGNPQSAEHIFLFLHGWTGNSDSWNNNIQSLPKEGNCYISVDLPGFGKSSEPTEIWDVECYAKFLHDFAQVLHLKKYILVGKSFGGRIATWYASKWGEDLEALILVSAAGVETRSIFARLKINLAKIGKIVLIPFPKKAKTTIRNLLYRIFQIEEDSNPYKWEVKKKVTNQDLSAIAKTINAPTLIVWGSEDEILPISVAKRLNKLIKNSTLKIIQGGHNAHETNPFEFNQTVEEFVSQLKEKVGKSLSNN